MTPNTITNPDEYTAAAIQAELAMLATMPDKKQYLNHPASPIFSSLLRLCAVAKGAGRNASQEQPAAVQAICKGTQISTRQAEKQFQNAWKLANPRQITAAHS